MSGGCGCCGCVVFIWSVAEHGVVRVTCRKVTPTLFCALLRCHQPDCEPFGGEEQSSRCGTGIFRRAVIGFNRCVSPALNAVSNVLVVAHDG